MSYLDLVEEYPKAYKMTLFEKVVMASKRAKDLHRGKAPLLVSDRKEPYLAIQEIKQRQINLVYRESEEVEALNYEAEEGDEEE